MELAAVGSFLAGGRPLTVSGRPKTLVSYSTGLQDMEHDPNGEFWIEQAYVQYFIPTRRRFAAPLLLVHGGGLTGAVWETKPDGGPGWLSWFLEAGIATYVIDNAERGRAGFCAHEDVWTNQPIVRSNEEAWSLYRFGQARDFASRTPFPGQQFPIEAMDGLARMTVPRWPANGPMMLAGLKAAIARIGRCIVLGHSQGGGLAMAAALEMPDEVLACILVEPHGLPTVMDRAAVRGRSSLLMMGDFITFSPAWQELGRKAEMAQRQWGDASGRAETLDLPGRGLRGNSHMPMMDRNSDAVAALLVEWLDQEHWAFQLV